MFSPGHGCLRMHLANDPHHAGSQKDILRTNMWRIIQPDRVLIKTPLIVCKPLNYVSVFQLSICNQITGTCVCLHRAKILLDNAGVHTTWTPQNIRIMRAALKIYSGGVEGGRLSGYLLSNRTGNSRRASYFSATVACSQNHTYPHGAYAPNKTITHLAGFPH